jgi:hypothetical protein
VQERREKQEAHAHELGRNEALEAGNILCWFRLDNFEIATPALSIPGQAQQKTLLAMTFRGFFSELSRN